MKLRQAFSWDAVREKISVEYVKGEILRTVYGNEKTFVASLDPRILLLWYLVFALAPWFFYDRLVLLGICLMVGVVALSTRVSGLILFMLAFGVASDLLGWGIAALLFGGDLTVFWSLSTYILKLLAVSLASITVFASLDPERFSDAMLALGLPGQFAFGLSYGYRMVPILLDEYNNIINAYRLRGKEPDEPGFLYWRKLVYLFKLIMRAFYPMILNTAKRSRTTVEGLEIRGFSHALRQPQVKKLKLQYLKVRPHDIAFLLGSWLLLVGLVTVRPLLPL